MALIVMRFTTRLLPAILLAFVGPVRADDKTTLKVEHYHIRSPEYATTRSFNEFQQRHPRVRLLPFTSLRLEGGAAAGMESTKLLCFAGHIGPDVLTIRPGQLDSFRNNGFLLDLSALVGRDENGDGAIDDRETTFEYWKTIPRVFRQAVTIGGRPFALPLNQSFEALLFRKDLLDEVFSRSRIKRPPRTWDELHYLCQKATRTQVVVAGARYPMGQRGIHLNTMSGFWQALVWSAGGRLMEAGKQSPTTGTWHWFESDEARFVVEDTGEDLSSRPTHWRAAFASDAGLEATAFYWKLAWAPWLFDPIADPKTNDHEPINLSVEEAQRGAVVLPGGREVRFEPSDVHWGVCRGTAAGDDVDAREALANGEVVFAFSRPTYLFRQVFLAAGVGPQSLGFCPVPASASPSSPGGSPVLVAERMFWGLNSELADQPQKLKVAFELLSWLEHELPRNEVRQSVEEGHGAIVDPNMLVSAGFDEYVDEVPPHLVQAYEGIDPIMRGGPFTPAWEAIRGELIGGVLAQLISSKDYDHRSGLQAAQQRANRIVIPGTGAAKRPDAPRAARYVVGAFILLSVVLTAFAVRTIRVAYMSNDGSQQGAPVGTARGVASNIMPWLLLMPALGLLALWSYYPMFKGSVMSFQAYSIAGRSQWIGLENFFNVLLDARFYKYALITLKFSFWSLLLGFLSPIVLALLLDEIPHFKFTMRMLYLLPNVCAGLVIVFLWKMMFYPTEKGFLNSLLLNVKLIREPLRFYQDPDMALLCCILPGIWASVGIGSLIYLAALKSVPTELYEAAEVDGANIRGRLRHITIPTIKPLIIINFIGAFIGTFHTMGNIFVMTGGGPDGQTTVLALKIWKDAFVYLNFGLATATAWVLGTALIAFTIWQLRILKKVEFRRASDF